MPEKRKHPIILSTTFSAIQKKEDIDAWRKWKETKSPQDLEALLKQVENIIHRSVADKRGSLPDQFLELKAKQYAVQAFETFDPTRGVALSTHLINNLRQLSRLNYTYRQTARVPEHQQRKIGDFLTGKDQLIEFLGRTPTSQELSDHLKWNLKEVHRLEIATRNELSDMKELSHEGAVAFAPVGTEIDPMIVFFYHELDPTDKLIFEYTTGYGGKPVLNNTQLSKKLKISYPQLSYKKRLLINKMKERLGK